MSRTNQFFAAIAFVITMAGIIVSQIWAPLFGPPSAANPPVEHPGPGNPGLQEAKPVTGSQDGPSKNIPSLGTEQRHQVIASSDQKQNGLILVVLPFEVNQLANSALNSNGKSYGEIARDMVEDIIINQGGHVVERRRLEAMLNELQFQNHSGLVEASTQQRIGELTGANVLIQGTVEDIQREASTFEGYGIKTDTTKVRTTVKVRAIELGTGRILFSQRVAGEEATTSSATSTGDDSQLAKRAIAQAMEQLAANQKLKTILTPQTSEPKP